MLSPLEIGLLVWAVVSLIAGFALVRRAYREGYQDGVADMQLALHDSLQVALRKRSGRDSPVTRKGGAPHA